jgi:hypothetical protein
MAPPSSITVPSAGADKQEILIRRIQKKMGGQARLKEISDPHVVRKIALDALAADQSSELEAARIRKDSLTSLERKCVRTVTNRVTSVRSRQRQRDQLRLLKAELVEKDAQLEELSTALASVQKVLIGLAPPGAAYPAAVAPPLQHDQETSLLFPTTESVLSEAEAAFFGNHVDTKADLGTAVVVPPPRMLTRAEEEALLSTLGCFSSGEDNETVHGMDSSMHGSEFDINSCHSD